MSDIKIINLPEELLCFLTMFLSQKDITSFRICCTKISKPLKEIIKKHHKDAIVWLEKNSRKNNWFNEKSCKRSSINISEKKFSIYSKYLPYLIYGKALNNLTYDYKNIISF